MTSKIDPPLPNNPPTPSSISPTVNNTSKKQNDDIKKGPAAPAPSPYLHSPPRDSTERYNRIKESNELHKQANEAGKTATTLYFNKTNTKHTNIITNENRQSSRLFKITQLKDSN